MDLIVDFIDDNLFSRPGLNPYASLQWDRNDWERQISTLFLILTIGGYLIYFIFATFSYFFIFDKRLMHHKKIIPNQILQEIQVTCISIPIMAVPTSLIFLAEIHSYSKLYRAVDFSSTSDLAYLCFSIFFFLAFTDCLIYWIHRWLHHPAIYKHIHKLHHKWVMPTPFASHAFHPLDGFLQSVPYHIFVFLFPLQKHLYIALFVFVNLWTVSIHDGDYRVPDWLSPAVNGAAHHTDHHLYFNYNYGQYFTFWDRLGGSFKEPTGLLMPGCHLRESGVKDTGAAPPRQCEEEEEATTNRKKNLKKEE